MVEDRPTRQGVLGDGNVGLVEPLEAVELELARLREEPPPDTETP